MRVKLEEVCKRIYAGGDVPKDRYSEMKTDKYSVPIYANAEKNNGLYGYTDKAREEELSITVAARGTIGFVAIRREPFLPVIRLITVVPDTKKISERYLYYVLKNCKPQFSGTSIPQLTVPDIKKNSLELYNISEQIQIAEQLDKISKIIELRKQQLSALDKLIKARFVEMFGDVRENPNGYAVVPFIDIVEYMGDIGSNGANKVVVEHLDMKDEEDYAMMVRFTNFTKNDFADDVKYISKDAYDFFKKSQIFGGELIICKIGSAGQNYVMPFLDRPVSLGLNQIMVRIKENSLMPYLYQYLHTDYGEFLISGCINGAVTKTITKTELKKIPVMLPPMEIQKEFESFVKQVNKSKVKVQKALDETQKLFDSLMQQYFG